jgi:DNA polymerase-3 subunit beta
MKINFNRQSISDSISPLMSTVSNKSTKPAVEGILIDAKEDGTCILTTFDEEKGMRITVEAEVEEAGTYIINAQKFAQTLRVMEGETVTLTVNDMLQACISSGKSNHRMNALPGSDYPAIPRLITEDGFMIGQAVLKNILSKVSCAMAVNNIRPELNGCYINVQSGKLLAVACDGSKLAKCSAETDIENKSEGSQDMKFSFIIPTKTVGELCKLLRDDERESVVIYMTRKNIVFRIGDIIFFSRLIEAQYIDYDRIIMTQHPISVNLDRARMIAALERAALVTEDKIQGRIGSHVKLSFEGDLLKISADSTLGSTYDELSIEHEGGDLVIAFNNRFLLESLRASDCESVKFSMSSMHTSINIEPSEKVDGKEELFMLLPIRMRG